MEIVVLSNELENGFFKESQIVSIIDDENCAKAERPPRNFPVMRHCISQATLADASKSSTSGENSGLVPVFRSGSCSEKGSKPHMEDEYVCVDNLCEHFESFSWSILWAAVFTRKKIHKFILEDSQFSAGVKRAIKNAFMKADYALADAKSLDCSSGTNALIALMLRRNLIIANAGDSQAVLGKRGRAIEMSKSEDEFLMISCDGLWDVMSSQCDVTIIRKKLMQHNNPEKCSTELVREAIKHNTCDNLTVVVICFSSDPPPQIQIPTSEREAYQQKELIF